MSWFKTLALDTLWLTIYLVVLPVSVYRRVVHGRPLGNWRERVLGLAPQLDPAQHTVWLHAVSVGEVNQLGCLLPRLQLQYPASRFVLSVTTATGMQLAASKFPDVQRFYFPVDFSWAVRNVLQRIKPDLLILTELEIWPNLTVMAACRNIPVVVINGRLSEKSFRGYCRLHRLVAPCFARLHLVIAQNEAYATRFRELGCRNVKVAGSIKFDGAAADPDSGLLAALQKSIQLDDGQLLWVAGSTQEPEEIMAARIWQSLLPDHAGLRLVIVPRHPHRGKSIQSRLAAAGIESQLRSADPQLAVPPDTVLISDTIGELAAWWSLAQAAFVGGSFGSRGGQNMIEPAAAGAAVCFGPNTWNFTKTVDMMLGAQVAEVVESEQQLRQFVERCLTDPRWARDRGQTARQFVLAQRGAVQRTLLWLAPLFSPTPGSLVDKAA